ncbi:hypothetical protein Hanom_Chr13g01204911 [Helianthus anomalus]
MEEENSVAAMMNNPEGIADGDSVCNNGEEQNMVDDNLMDDTEEGEIRSPVRDMPLPETEDDPAQVQPVEAEKLNNDEALHGNYGDNHGEHSAPRESDNVFEEIAGLAAESGGGPNIMEERETQSGVKKNPDGPTPSIGLGKRNRDTRSPPSTGSMQGPPNRCFFQNPPADPLFDLNRPSNSHVSLNSLDGREIHQDHTVQADPAPQPEPDVTAPYDIGGICCGN